MVFRKSLLLVLLALLQDHALAVLPRIAAGGFHAIALKNDGTLVAMGADGSGQLGLGRSMGSSTPLRASGLTQILAVAGGDGHSVALGRSGAVWTWGDNSLGQLGDGTVVGFSDPSPVPGLRSVTAIASGSRHTIALRQDGNVWGWGSNGSGQLGIGANHSLVPAPVQITGLVPAGPLELDVAVELTSFRGTPATFRPGPK